jgi:hypothetical protein
MDIEAAYREFTKGYVYFIQGQITRRIKIGYTGGKLSVRLSQLQVGSPDKLSLLGWFWGNEDVEAYTQATWRKQWVYGEWFDESPELLKYIEENNCASESS